MISKSFLVVCAATLCIAPLSLPAADSETQIRAREALEKKLNELQTQEPASAARPAPAPRKSKPPVETAPTPRPVPPAQPTAPAPVVEPTPSPAPVPAPSVQPPPPPPPPPPVATPPAPEPAAQPPVRYVPGSLPRPDSDAVAKSREALRQKINEL